MKILKNINDLKKAINGVKDLGFVPTMGGIHDGHISLIKESKKKSKKTLVSIYVNPNQFNDLIDFKKYPRRITKDLKKMKKLKINYLFLPNTKNIYHPKRRRKIFIKKREKIMCAKYRKGHFEGVLDIMDRFINIIQPKFVFMGKKDFQQFFLVKEYMKNKYKTKIISCKTIRDNNFLPLSTRNFLLSKKDIKKAGLISFFLNSFKKNIIKQKNINKFLLTLKDKLQKKFNINIEYLQLMNEKKLNQYKKKCKSRLFIAYYIKEVRLIDNF